MFLEVSLVNQQSLVILAMSVAMELSRCGCSMKLGPLLHASTTPLSTKIMVLAVGAVCYGLTPALLKKTTPVDTCTQQVRMCQTEASEQDIYEGEAPLKIA